MTSACSMDRLSLPAASAGTAAAPALKVLGAVGHNGIELADSPGDSEGGHVTSDTAVQLERAHAATLVCLVLSLPRAAASPAQPSSCELDESGEDKPRRSISPVIAVHGGPRDGSAGGKTEPGGDVSGSPSTAAKSCCSGKPDGPGCGSKALLSGDDGAPTDTTDAFSLRVPADLPPPHGGVLRSLALEAIGQRSPTVARGHRAGVGDGEPASTAAGAGSDPLISKGGVGKETDSRVREGWVLLESEVRALQAQAAALSWMAGRCG